MKFVIPIHIAKDSEDTMEAMLTTVDEEGNQSSSRLIVPITREQFISLKIGAKYQIEFKEVA